MDSEEPLDFDSLNGQLLLASPELLDPNFYRSIVLICRHGKDGALGLILNRPTDLKLKQVWQDLDGTERDTDQLIYLGGPVEGPLIALHKHESLADFEVLPGVYLTMDKDKLAQVVSEDDATFRFYMGHAGWAPGQLEVEMNELSWKTVAAQEEHVFHDEPMLWEQLVGETTRPSFLPDIRHLPPDPSLN